MELELSESMDQIVWLLYICFGCSPATYFTCVKCLSSLYLFVFYYLPPFVPCAPFSLFLSSKHNIDLAIFLLLCVCVQNKCSLRSRLCSFSFTICTCFTYYSMLCTLWFLLICSSCLKIYNSAFKWTQTCTSWCLFHQNCLFLNTSATFKMQTLTHQPLKLAQ